MAREFPERLDGKEKKNFRENRRTIRTIGSAWKVQKLKSNASHNLFIVNTCEIKERIVKQEDEEKRKMSEIIYQDDQTVIDNCVGGSDFMNGEDIRRHSNSDSSSDEWCKIDLVDAKDAAELFCVQSEHLPFNYKDFVESKSNDPNCNSVGKSDSNCNRNGNPNCDRNGNPNCDDNSDPNCGQSIKINCGASSGGHSYDHSRNMYDFDINISLGSDGCLGSANSDSNSDENSAAKSTAEEDSKVIADYAYLYPSISWESFYDTIHRLRRLNTPMVTILRGIVLIPEPTFENLLEYGLLQEKGSNCSSITNSLTSTYASASVCASPSSTVMTNTIPNSMNGNIQEFAMSLPVIQEKADTAADSPSFAHVRPTTDNYEANQLVHSDFSLVDNCERVFSQQASLENSAIGVETSEITNNSSKSIANSSAKIEIKHGQEDCQEHHEQKDFNQPELPEVQDIEVDLPENQFDLPSEVTVSAGLSPTEEKSEEVTTKSSVFEFEQIFLSQRVSGNNPAINFLANTSDKTDVSNDSKKILLDRIPSMVKEKAKELYNKQQLQQLQKLYNELVDKFDYPQDVASKIYHCETKDINLITFSLLNAVTYLESSSGDLPSDDDHDEISDEDFVGLYNDAIINHRMERQFVLCSVALNGSRTISELLEIAKLLYTETRLAGISFDKAMDNKPKDSRAKDEEIVFLDSNGQSICLEDVQLANKDNEISEQGDNDSGSVKDDIENKLEAKLPIDEPSVNILVDVVPPEVVIDANSEDIVKKCNSFDFEVHEPVKPIIEDKQPELKLPEFPELQAAAAVKAEDAASSGALRIADEWKNKPIKAEFPTVENVKAQNPVAMQQLDIKESGVKVKVDDKGLHRKPKEEPRMAEIKQIIEQPKVEPINQVKKPRPANKPAKPIVEGKNVKKQGKDQKKPAAKVAEEKKNDEKKLNEDDHMKLLLAMQEHNDFPCTTEMIEVVTKVRHTFGYSIEEIIHAVAIGKFTTVESIDRYCLKRSLAMLSGPAVVIPELMNEVEVPNREAQRDRIPAVEMEVADEHAKTEDDDAKAVVDLNEVCRTLQETLGYTAATAAVVLSANTNDIVIKNLLGSVVYLEVLRRKLPIENFKQYIENSEFYEDKDFIKLFQEARAANVKRLDILFAVAIHGAITLGDIQEIVQIYCTDNAVKGPASPLAARHEDSVNINPENNNSVGKGMQWRRSDVMKWNRDKLLDVMNELQLVSDEEFGLPTKNLREILMAILD